MIPFINLIFLITFVNKFNTFDTFKESTIRKPTDMI